MASAEYGLVLRLQPGGDGVAAAAQTPPDVDSADIVAAAAHRAQAPGFVVREMRVRLAQRLRRRLLIEGVPPQHALSMHLQTDTCSHTLYSAPGSGACTRSVIAVATCKQLHTGWHALLLQACGRG